MLSLKYTDEKRDTIVNTLDILFHILEEMSIHKNTRYSNRNLTVLTCPGIESSHRDERT